MKKVPFSRNDNFLEIILECFSMIQLEYFSMIQKELQKELSYRTCQAIDIELAKLKLLEEQGCIVESKDE